VFILDTKEAKELVFGKFFTGKHGFRLSLRISIQTPQNPKI